MLFFLKSFSEFLVLFLPHKYQESKIFKSDINFSIEVKKILKYIINYNIFIGIILHN